MSSSRLKFKVPVDSIVAPDLPESIVNKDFLEEYVAQHAGGGIIEVQKLPTTDIKTNIIYSCNKKLYKYINSSWTVLISVDKTMDESASNGSVLTNIIGYPDGNIPAIGEKIKSIYINTDAIMELLSADGNAHIFADLRADYDTAGMEFIYNMIWSVNRYVYAGNYGYDGIYLFSMDS